jgi:hypothetical protein
MKIEVSIGEVVDKLSILAIKKKNIEDANKLKNISKEYAYLYDVVFNKLKIEFSDYSKLVDVNTILWQVEDDLREKEYEKLFDNSFIELARLVYVTNDQRADIKKEINVKYGSRFVEEKSYTKYN